MTKADALAWLWSLADALDAAQRVRDHGGDLLTLAPAPEWTLYVKITDALLRDITTKLRVAQQVLAQ